MPDSLERSVRQATGSKINLLHLRHADGWGGGPDTVLPFTLSLLDQCRFHGAVAYLVNSGKEITQIKKSMRESAVEATEFSGGRFIDPVQIYRLHRMIRDRKIDILHCHEPKSDVYGLLLKLFNPRLKLVSTMHGWIVHSRKSQFFNALDKLVLRAYSLLIAVAEDTMRKAEQSGLKGIVLLRNGVVTDYWQAAEKAACSEAVAATIGFAGRLSREKGVADFIRAASLISADYPCRFLIAGEGPELCAAKELVAELELEKKVSFLGLLSREEMKDFYQQLDLLLLTSYTEGMPNVLLQALSMELPTVATKVGGVEELVQHERTGLLSVAGDVPDIAEQALRLLKNPSLAATLGRAGRKHVENEFSMVRRVRKLEDLYFKVMESR